MSVTTVLFPGVTGLGLNDTNVPPGTPLVADKVIGPEKPPILFVPRVTDMEVGAGHVAVAAAGVLKEKPELTDGITAVHIPRPCVAAKTVRSEERYLIISVRTLGKEVLGVHTVLAPFSKSVSHIPVSVAMIALLLSSGWNIPHLTGMFGRFPSQAVHDVPPFDDIHTLVTP